MRNHGPTERIDGECGIPEFGTAVPGVEYKLRPGGYVVVVNPRWQVAVIETNTGKYLPGGGLESRETPAQTAIRETMEECGLEGVVTEEIGTADELLYAAAESTYYRKRGVFFMGTLSSYYPAMESDHRLAWLTPDEAIQRLSHGSHAWAVERFVNGPLSSVNPCGDPGGESPDRGRIRTGPSS